MASSPISSDGSHDSNGNRTNTGYSTGTNNQLSSDGTYNYLYDANGNMTKKTTISSGAYVTYTWDYHNRLTDVKFYTSANVLTEHINYVYDVFDRLIEKQLDPTGGGTYTSKQSFVYDGDSVILAYNASNALTDRFLMLPPLSKGGPGGAGQPVLTGPRPRWPTRTEAAPCRGSSRIARATRSTLCSTTRAPTRRASSTT